MKNKQLQIVSFDQAKRLKEAGFNVECFERWKYDRFNGEVSVGFSDTNPVLRMRDWNVQKIKGFVFFSAPTVALALKWIRDEKGILSHIMFITVSFLREKYGYRGEYINTKKVEDTRWSDSYTPVFDTYEECESYLLEELLTLIEKK